MHDDVAAIDIEGSPELERIAEEVNATGEPRSLRRNGKEIARVVPARQERSRLRSSKDWEPSDADIAAFLSSAGSWSDDDADLVLNAAAESRRLGSRPPVDL